MAHRPEGIRNVTLFGHGSSGKTALIDAVAYVTKATNRHGNTADGSSVSDSEPEEKERKQTLTLRTEDAILLAAPEHDAIRVAWLIDRVTMAADTLEQRLLPGADQPAETFRGRFEEEADRAD